MEKLFFLSLLAFATLLVSCEQKEPEQVIVVESPELDAFVLTEQFDTLTCRDPHVFVQQHVKDVNTVYNFMEVKIEDWTFQKEDIIVEMPVYVFYFLSPQTSIGYIPSGVYTFSTVDNQPWSVKHASRDVYTEYIWVQNDKAQKESTEVLKQCCIKINQCEQKEYNIQIWMEMDTEPYFRYIQLDKRHIDINNAAGNAIECNWWHIFQ